MIEKEKEKELNIIGELIIANYNKLNNISGIEKLTVEKVVKDTIFNYIETRS